MKNPHLSRTNRAYIEQFLEKVEQQRIQQPCSEAEVERILADMQSEDALTRANAVREICPCRMPWEIFHRLHKVAKRLQHDPNPLVRAHALHIEEDARMVANMEGEIEYLQEFEDAGEDQASKSKKRHKWQQW